MKQKILIAFDDSENAMRAVEFIARSFTPDHRITLFSVIPDTAAICDMDSPSLTPYFLAQQGAFCSLEEKKRQFVKEALNKAKELLLNAGFEEDNIISRIETKKKGIARDIIEEAESGYHLVVLGRRGLSGIERFLLGSVSQKVLHAVKGVSVLLID